MLSGMFWGAPRSTQAPTRSTSLIRVTTPPAPSLDGTRARSQSVPATSGEQDLLMHALIRQLLRQFKCFFDIQHSATCNVDCKTFHIME